MVCIVAHTKHPLSTRGALPGAIVRSQHIQCTVATMSSSQDPLILLRQSIASDSPCIPITSTDAITDASLATAAFLHFTSPVQLSLPLSTPTRFISKNNPVNLRSIYFAWLKKDSTPSEYNAGVQALNAELTQAGSTSGLVEGLSYVERIDLTTYLEGGTEESEYIKALPADTSAALASAQVASGAVGGIAPVTSGLAGRQGKDIDPRLQEIYNGERRMGDRNSVLRGIKPTVRSNILENILNGAHT
jgi:parafibromin